MAFVNVTVRVPADLIAKIEARVSAQIARRPGLCKSDVIREIIADHFIREETEGGAACGPPQTPK